MQASPFLPQELRRRLAEWQQHLHRRPELGYAENETTDYLAREFAALDGVEVARPTKTGLVATLRGGAPGRLVAWRADIDALPIEEDALHPCRSENPGVMHACGHDGHMAMALGAAAYLSSIRGELRGDVRFILQHAEETPPGGAREMIEVGALDGVEAIVGCHLESKGVAGGVYVLPGPMLASTNTFEIEVLGKGGHAASPHQTVDPVLVGSQLVCALQGIISRRRNPLHRLVLSVTQFHAGTKDNIIPQTATLGGTVRILDPGPEPGYAALLPAWMEETVRGVCASFGADYRFRFEPDYDALCNDERVARLVREVAVATVGEELVFPGEPNMAGDDMGSYLQRVPGCYFVVGCGEPSEDGVVYPNHHPKFRIHPHALPAGTEMAVNALRALLEE